MQEEHGEGDISEGAGSERGSVESEFWTDEYYVGKVGETARGSWAVRTIQTIQIDRCLENSASGLFIHKVTAYGWASLLHQIANADLKRPLIIKGISFTDHWTGQGVGIHSVFYSCDAIARRSVKTFAQQ